jgi:hypothetical protein
MTDPFSCLERSAIMRPVKGAEWSKGGGGSRRPEKGMAGVIHPNEDRELGGRAALRNRSHASSLRTRLLARRSRGNRRRLRRTNSSPAGAKGCT